MRIAMLSPIAWRTPPRHYGPWERIVSILTEGLVQRGIDVTLFATADSQTQGRLHAVCPHPYEEDRELNPKVWECLHISEVFEHAGEFDLIHNQYDFLPLTYSRLIDTPILTTIHGFSSPKIVPVYKKYNGHSYYVAISNADRHPELDYIATIYHGIPLDEFTFQENSGDYLLFFGRIHHEKGTAEAIQLAQRTGFKLIIAGIIQDQAYFDQQVRPFLDGRQINYIGSVGPRERNKVLGGAYALLHLINFEEPFGLSLVEAMACGTPVIAFPRGSIPEIISPGKTGILVTNIDEAIEAVEKVKTLNRSACRMAVEERFSQDRMVRDYLEVYHKILKERKIK
jgi:glycosyltransferase involved in cell wall biosynthesis